MQTLIARPGVFAAGYPHETELPDVLADEVQDPWKMGVGITNGVRPSRVPPFHTWLAPETHVEDGTVLRSAKVTREAISFSARPVVIEIPDDQAAQLKRLHDRGSAAE
jgi:hypothetical protein